MVNLNRLWRRQDPQYRFLDKPARERHFISIAGSVLSNVLLILALALKNWAKGDDKRCSYVYDLTEVKVHDSVIPDNSGTRSSELLHEHVQTIVSRGSRIFGGWK